MSHDQMIGSGRPMRVCTREHDGMAIGCGQVDDHPRHVIDTGVDQDIQFHLDCHAAAGCTSCRGQLVDRPDGATGRAMLDHVMAQTGQGLDAENALQDKES